MALIGKNEATCYEQEKLWEDKESSDRKRWTSHIDRLEIVRKYSLTASQRLLWGEVSRKLVKEQWWDVQDEK